MDQSLGQFKWAQSTENLLLGDLHPLLEQLGSADGLLGLDATSALLLCPKIDNEETLGVFLKAYEGQLLFPLELPAIFRAYNFACQNHTRELIALDVEQGPQPFPADFAKASRRVGQLQLQRLRPLRDQRVVQRYLEAVEKGQASGWHTLVYGLSMAVYSLPVRQGLMGYARQTLNGFIQAAARPLRLSIKECQRLLEIQCADLPRQMEKVVRVV